MSIRGGLAVLLGAGLASFAAAANAQLAPEPVAPAPAAATAPAPAAAVPAAPHLTAGTPVDIEITETVTSNLSPPGTRFGIRLARPILYEGRIVAPAGLVGQGEVVDSHRSGMAGRPGELILAARFVDDSGVRIPLRAFKFGQTGQNNGGVAMAVGIAVGMVTIVPVELFIPGGEIKVLPGTLAVAKIAADVDIASLPPVAPPASELPVGAPASSPPPQQGPAQ